MKTQYSLIRDLFQWVYNGSNYDRKQVPLLDELLEQWGKERPEFHLLCRDLVEQRQVAYQCGWLAIISFLLMLFVVVPWSWPSLKLEDAAFTQVCLPLLSCFFGLGLGVWGFSFFKLNSGYAAKKLDEFLYELGVVLFALREYWRVTYSQKRFIRNILRHRTMEHFLRFVDELLVNLAFKVRELEPNRLEFDEELMIRRKRFKNVHAAAVKLGVAKINPQTYFDRAVPASATAQPATTAS